VQIRNYLLYPRFTSSDKSGCTLCICS